jgi:diacylglycerol kinase (ATP)
MRVLLVFNPAACSGRAARTLPAIVQAFAARGVVAETLLTRHAGHATAHLAACSLQGFDGVVAAGGDGTLFEVVNGLYRREHPERIALGVIPLGTGNAFARDLGLEPGDWAGAVNIIAAARKKAVDVGRVATPSGQFHFLNIIGMGFVVDAGLTARKLKHLGRGAYTLATLWQVLKLKAYRLQLETDGKIIEQDNVFVAISNTRYTGTTFLIAPSARMDDGLLDVTLLRKLPRLRVLRLFPTIYSGRHVEFEEVSVIQARSIRILSPAGYPMAPDGEFRGETPAEITCLHRDLDLFCV